VFNSYINPTQSYGFLFAPPPCKLSELVHTAAYRKLYEFGLKVFTAMSIRLTSNVLHLRASSMYICAQEKVFTVSVWMVALIVNFTYVS
jgi:hypothetical protein